MIRESFQHIASHYLEARAQPVSGHPIAQYLRNDARDAVADGLGNPYFQVVGSAGQGQWAQVPWISVFDPTVTTSATRGYYIVYLFAASMQRVYLCLSQGTTAVREEFKDRTHDELRRRAALICDRLPQARQRFSRATISLEGTSTLAQDYEPATAYNVPYELAALPAEDVLTADLRQMARLYLALTAQGGLGTFEDVIAGSEAETVEGKTFNERRRYRQHRKIERNSKAAKEAKRVHGHTCQVCDMDFELIYGPAGRGYIEAHHLTPLAELPEDVPVAQDPKTDFAVLCANCHRMIHRPDAPKTVAELRALQGVADMRTLVQILKE